MNFIKKIKDKNFDESVHLQFQKFSKGEFRYKAAIGAKFSGGKYTINTGAEFANELVEMVAEKLGSNKTTVKGAIVSTLDLKDNLEFKEVKQFQGVKRYIMDLEMSGQEILALQNKFPKAFFALSFETPEGMLLKIKPKAPKSGKPGKKDAKFEKPNFCKLITKDEAIAKSFVFEVPNFKNALITHNFIIESIEIPEELKNSKDFALIRERSKRVGKIIRKAIIDEKESEAILEFSA